MRWSMIARTGSVLLPIVIAMLAGPIFPVFVAPAFGQATQPAVTSQDGNNPDAATDDVSRDNPGSDDGDGGSNDDPVWGYFLGKSAFIFFHELARNLTAQTGGAVIADTAAKRDQLTALLLTTEGKKHFGGTVLSDAVAGWVVSWRQAQQDDANSPGPDEETPDTWDTQNVAAQQMSDLLCAVYGSDPRHFHSLIDSGDIKAAAAEGCVAGYRKLNQRWAAILSEAGLSLVMAKEDATGAAQDNGRTALSDAVAPSTAILTLEQQPSTAPELADFTGWLHDVALFDNLISETNRDLRLAAPIKVVLLQCGTNIDVTGKAGSMSICYEWLKPGYDAATAQNVEAPPE